MRGSAARAAVLGLTTAFLVSGCVAVGSVPEATPRTTPIPAPSSLNETPSPAPSPLPPTQEPEPTPFAGPPFPAREPGVVLVDEADVFSAATEQLATSRIADIATTHDVSVVVFTQFKPGSTDRSTKNDAIALKLKWRLVDGLVIMWNTTSPRCVADGGGNGHIQLYADSVFSATRLSDLKRQKIFDDLMLPLLRDCNEDEALLAGLDGIADEIHRPTAGPEASDSPGSPGGACDDGAFKLSGFALDGPFEWSFQEASVPDEYDADAVLEVLTRSADNITSGRNDCGLPDRIDATATYLGTTTEPPCESEQPDGVNSVGFAKLPDAADADLLAFVCPYGGRDVVEEDILINADVPWALSQDECVFFEELLEATMTHEFGHAFGLGHVSERQHGDLTMSPTSNGPCDAEEITLGLGDIYGLEELY